MLYKKIYLTFIMLLSCLIMTAGEAVRFPFHHLTVEDGLLNDEILALTFDKSGMLWIKTQSGWNTWDGTKVRTVTAGTSLPQLHNPSAREISQWQNIHLPKSTNVANTILDVKDDNRGNLWIATDHQGIYIYNKVKKTFTNLVYSSSQSNSIAENHVSCIAVSSDGTVALGHIKKGVSIYSPSPFPLFNFQSSSWRNVSSVIEDHEGNLWVGTDGFGLFNITKRKHYDIPGNIVVTLMEDNRGCLWIGTYKQGIIVMKDGKIIKRYVKSNNHLSDDNVYSLCQDRTGRIWIGTLWGFLQSLNPENNQWKDFKTKDKNESIVMDFAYDGKDNLYAGTLSGLCRIDIRTGKRTQIFSSRAGKPFLHKEIQSLLLTRNGELWIAHGHGITIWNTTTDDIQYLTKAQGLCDDVIRSLSEDATGRIWVGTSNGISVITETEKRIAEGQNSAFHIVNINIDNGLLDNNISRQSIVNLHDGNVVIGSYEGFTLAEITGKQSPLEQIKPYELGEGHSFWTSGLAILLYIIIVFAVIVTIFIVRRTKRKKVIEVSPDKIEVTSGDELLVKNAIKAVEENIANDFTVEDLSKALGLTRGHLYKKLTALTGKTPVEFIRTIRIKRACQLLDESGMNVGEVAYAVGYSSPKIFTRNFKAEMGITPTEYKNKSNG